MYKQWLLLFICQVLVCYSNSMKEKCRVTDSACMVKSFQQQLPNFVSGNLELGIESLDPMVLNEIKLNVGGLQFEISDETGEGLKNSVIKDINFDMESKIAQLECLADIILKGRYVLSGKMLLIPITGQGDFRIDIKKLKILYTVPFEIVKNENGKDIIELSGFKFKYVIEGNVHCQFDNIYNGNKFLGDMFHKFLNNNWREMTKEIGSTLLDKPSKKVYEAVKTYWRAEQLKNKYILN